MDHKIFFHKLRKGARVLSVVLFFLGLFLYATTTAQSQEEHESPASQEDMHYIIQVRNLCKTATICDKLRIHGTISPKDRYTYLAMMEIVLSTIDTGLESAGYAAVTTALKEVAIHTKGGERRGSANRSRITIHTDMIASYEEFLQVFTHELAHIVDLGVLQGTQSQKDLDYTEFGKPVFSLDDPSFIYYNFSRYAEDIRHITSKTQNFCSGYAMKNPFEDFAECFNLYVNNNAYFRYLAVTNTVLQKKYENIDSMLNGNYVFENTNKKNLLAQYGESRRGRDTTRLVR